MINMEKILGGLLKTAVSGGLRAQTRHSRSRGGMFGASRGAIGMGIIGVAMAAFDHFMQARGTGNSAPAAPVRSAFGPPPPPPPSAPWSGATPPPPPPAPPQGPVKSGQALVLLRAMIAAANADQVIDASERSKILERIEAAGITTEERAFVEQEFAAPKSPDDIALEALAQGLASEAYLVSLLAIDIDSPAEALYLRRLGPLLRLDAASISRAHEQAGVPALS